MQLNDFYLPLKSRPKQKGYICRFVGVNDYIEQFLVKYYKETTQRGVVIQGRIPNPTDANLRFYKEMLGENFELSVEYISSCLGMWLVKLQPNVKRILAQNLYDVLMQLKNKGKNLNIIKNTYIKFMCWLYFQFERVLQFTPTHETGKVLYAGELSLHEFDLLTILANCGVDVVILALKGEVQYRVVDPTGERSELYNEKTQPFRSDFSVHSLAPKPVPVEVPKTIFPKAYTNEWVNDDAFEGILTFKNDRSCIEGHYSNVFVVFKGADNKVNFSRTLSKFYNDLKESKRRIVLENGISRVLPQEISAVKRELVSDIDGLVNTLQTNLADIGYVRFHFGEMVKEIYAENGNNLQRTTNKAVQLVALFKRYEKDLVRTENVPVFIYFGEVVDLIVDLFLRFVSRLLVDVVIIVPSPDGKCLIEEDSRAAVVQYSDDLGLDEYPTVLDNVHVGTMAYTAEAELTEMMYQDTGMYRQNQYGKAKSVTLRTTCEEIDILWNNELRFRPNFSTSNDMVE
ncbi:MAG: hypothetical protein ATN33_04045, partial [Epulopiscium sp. Nele67-Bin001]